MCVGMWCLNDNNKYIITTATIALKLVFGLSKMAPKMYLCNIMLQISTGHQYNTGYTLFTN